MQAAARGRDHSHRGWQAGGVVRIFSHSTNAWVEAQSVTLAEEDGYVQVEFEVGELLFRKTVHVDSDSLRLPAAILDKMRREQTVQVLLNRGIPLWQMLDVYCDLRADGRLSKGMKTFEVVRDIVIPETAEEAGCFMESKYMRQRGWGGKWPHKLLSHTWGAEMRDSVLSMAQDATGLSPSQLEEDLDSGCLVQTLERKQAFKALDTVYWWCAFAVNQHISICGSDWNPCSCGSQHFGAGHPKCEIDKFEKVLAHIPGGIVVSLDPSLGALSRVWCLAEISTALHLEIPIVFRLARGMTEKVKEAVSSGQHIIPRVADCKASRAEDKVCILNKIKATLGYDRFDQEIRVLFEMQGPHVSGFSLWRHTQAPADWRKLQEHYYSVLSQEERDAWREREIAAFDRSKYLQALRDPYRFEFQYQSRNASRHVVGTRIQWDVAKAKFNHPVGPREFDGELPADMTVYETIGPGPKLFGVIESKGIYYHDFGKWSLYESGVPIPTA